jgi:hypothetical protein
VTIPQIYIRARDPIATTIAAQASVPIRCVFVLVVSESEICRVYETVLYIIKVLVHNLYRTSNLLAKVTT